MAKIKFISWNVNGLRACIGKGFIDFFRAVDADFFCLQEVKMQEDQIHFENAKNDLKISEEDSKPIKIKASKKDQHTVDLDGYYKFWNSAEKKGYSGTAIFTKHMPISVQYDIGIEQHAHEGRVITLEMDDFFLVNVYTPNSKEKLARIDYRMEWEDDFRNYLMNLDKVKPVILCGDLNVAHNEIDLKNPSSNRKNAGFSDQERNKMSTLLSSGFIDTFRYFYPDRANKYTWWSYRFNARANNAGWRIDYFITSERLISRLKDSIIHDEVYGSDHCPVELLFL